MRDVLPANIDVSLCVANYNGEKVIRACLQSIYAHNSSLAIEVLVHDDCSTDESLAIIQSEFPSVQLIISDCNVGFCVSNNRMAAQARGKYLLLLNNDASLFPDALQTLFDTASELDPCILTLPQYNAVNHHLMDCGMNMDIFANPIPLDSILDREVAMVMGSCLWIPRTLWRKLGGFPEWFTSIGEDMYLCCLCRFAGYKVIAVGKSGYRHHVGFSFGGGKSTDQNKLETSFKRRVLSESNKTKVMLLFYPLTLLIGIFPLHLALLLIEGIILSILRKNTKILTTIYWPAIAGNVGNIRTLCAYRARLHVLKNCSARQFFSLFEILPHKLRMLMKYGIPTIN